MTKPLMIFIPKTDFTSKYLHPSGESAVTIRYNSAIVGIGEIDSDGLMVIHFEGNLYGASNLKTYAERIQSAAGRLLHSYPTMAMAGVPTSDFVRVGTYDPTTKAIEIDYLAAPKALQTYLTDETYLGSQDEIVPRMLLQCGTIEDEIEVKILTEMIDRSPIANFLFYLILELFTAGKLTESDLKSGTLIKACEALLNARDMSWSEDGYTTVIEGAVKGIDDLEPLWIGDRKRRVHSIVVNWNDRDLDEGTFGSTLRAVDEEHASYLVKIEMELNDSGSQCGSVIEISHGWIWDAERLEENLRAVLALEIPNEIAENPAWINAKRYLDEIDQRG